MTAQEQEMIDGLVQRIRSTQVNDKDVQAEQYLQQGLAGYPDATYVLAQTVLVQQYGLQQAQQQIKQLQAQTEQLQEQVEQLKQHAQQSGGGSFLSHLFGGGQSQQGSQPAQPSPAYAQQPAYQPVNNPGYPPQAYVQPTYGAPPAYPQPYPPTYAQPVGYAPMGGGGGFLRGALQTAAGVAAGEILVDELFHGFGGEHGGGYGGGRPEEIINNNYYGDSGDRGYDGERGEHEHREVSQQDDSSFYNPSNDASRENFSSSDRHPADTQQFATPVDSDQPTDDTQAEDTQTDDSSYQDDSNSGYDDSGSGFDGGSDDSSS